MLNQRLLTTITLLIISIPVVILVLRQTIYHPWTQTTHCEGLIRHFEQADSTTSLSGYPILLLGDSRLYNWQSPPSTLLEIPLVVRNHGGLELEALDSCFNRLVAFYQPSTIILALDDRPSLEGGQLFINGVQRLLEQRDYYSLNFNVVIVGRISTPSLQASAGAIAGFNRLVSDWASESLDVSFVDPNPVLTDENSNIDARLFRPDGHTLIEAGYQRIWEAIESFVRVEMFWLEGV